MSFIWPKSNDEVPSWHTVLRTADAANHCVGRPVWGCFCFSSLLVSLVPLFLSFCLFFLFSQTIQPCTEWPQAHSLNFIFFFKSIRIFSVISSSLLTFNTIAAVWCHPMMPSVKFLSPAHPFIWVPIAVICHISNFPSQTEHSSPSHHDLIPEAVSGLLFPLLSILARNTSLPATHSGTPHPTP